MSARDELARTLQFAKELADPNWSLSVPPVAKQHIAELVAIIEAGPRTITTAEELDGLPVGSVIRTAGTNGDEPRVAVKDGMWKCESEWLAADSSEWCLDSTELDDLPATVLYEPEPQP